jgi:hypothetical protein
MNQLLESELARVEWDQPAAPKAATTGHQVVDYLGRIHWWVRLFGIVWLASVAAAMVFATLFVALLATR